MFVHTSCRIIVSCVAMTLTAACTVKESDGRDGGRDDQGSGGALAQTGGSGSSVDSGSGGAGGGTGGSTMQGGTTGAPATGGTGATGGTTSSSGASGGLDDGGQTSDAGTFIDNCNEAEMPPNNDRDHTTPIALGSTVHACLQTTNDVDMYAFTVPASPIPGGVVVARFTNVDTSGDIEMRFQSDADNGTFGDSYGLSGTNVTGWFAAIAGKKYRLMVTSFISANQTKYTLALSYMPVLDVNEPDDTRQTAATIQPGTPVAGYFFSGIATSTQTKPADNWYKVTLPAGMATVALTHVPTSVKADVALLSSDGVVIAEHYGAAGGDDVTVQNMVTAADYYVHLYTINGFSTLGTANDLPDNFITAYTLTVSVK